MASIKTLGGEDAYYHLPDPNKFAFLPLASRTLKHLEAMVASEVGDRDEVEEWERKQVFMATLLRHIKAYREFADNDDDDDSSGAEFEDEVRPTKNAKKAKTNTRK